MNTEKIEANSIYEMQKEVLKAIKQIPSEIATALPQQERQEIDLSALEAMLTENVPKPQEVRHSHTHTIDIGSSRVFILIVILSLMVLGLMYGIARQRDTINTYKNNDLKYRYIYMMGEIDGKGITGLEQRFLYSDSVRMVRQQVEEYERLVEEQAESLERARREAKKVEQLKDKANEMKKK
jgi:hypothetical protein